MWTVVSCPDPAGPGTHATVGASLLAMDVNDNVCLLIKTRRFQVHRRSSSRSKLAPTDVGRSADRSAVLGTAFFMPALLRHATGGRRHPSHLAFGPRIAHDIGFIQGLAGAFRGWRRCGGRWRWRTGTAAENDGAKYERHWSKNAFPKTVHRMTREKGCTHGCDNKTPP